MPLTSALRWRCLRWQLRDAHAIPADLNRFHCDNALSFAIPQGEALRLHPYARPHARAYMSMCMHARAVQSSRRASSGTALVYVDDTAWDAPTIDQLAKQLATQLPSGVVVIHNTEHGYTDPTAYRKLQAVSVGTSWNPSHTVYVHMTV